MFRVEWCRRQGSPTCDLNPGPCLPEENALLKRTPEKCGRTKQAQSDERPSERALRKIRQGGESTGQEYSR